MKALRNIWLWLAIVVLVAGGWYGYRTWAGKETGPEYRIARIERGAITASVSASGTLNPVVSVQVGSQVSGQLRDVLVDYNTPVKRGQLIARIDPESFEYRVRQAQADLDAAQAQVMTQQANQAAQRASLAKAEVDLAEAKRDLARKQQLVERGFLSSAEQERALAVYHAALEQVNTAKAQGGVAAAGLRNAQAVVKQREAALAQARTELGRTEIRAPVDGVVIKRSVERGQTVAASLQAPELFVIAENLSDMQVEAAIDESEIGRLREGQRATFTVDAFPGRSFEGTVKQIRLAAQNVSNVVTYTVVISAANPRGELLPGMTANVRVVTASRDDVLKVANGALRFRPPGAAPVAQTAGRAGADIRTQLDQLDLSAEQRGQLEGVFAEERERRAAAGAEQGERPRTAARNRAETRARIMAILTPEQKKKFEAMADAAESGGQPGRIYVLDDKRQPRPIDVRLGLADSSATEILSPEVREGMEVIVGTALPGAANASRPPGPRLF
ncbi:MAG TPA: efflux RND transporter periplasmic adaptor subunit [Noviherbaspirillum sp.]|nr:efflux RND transporter periplasmic adaptor subunit [Noviherbaspirillum sp.]